MKGSTGSNAAPPLARAQPRGLPSGRDPMRGMGIGGARLRRAAAGVLALLLAVPALAADWYAAPGGSGSLCSQASPCTIQGAIDAAAPYDTVHVAAGDYAFTSNRIVIETEGLRLVGDNSPFAKPYATPPGPGQIAHGTADNKAANASVLKAASAAAAGGGTSAMVWVRNVPNVRIEKLYIEVNSSAPFLGSPRAKEGIAATGNVNGLELVDNYIKITSGTAAIGLGLNLSAGSNSSVPAAEPRGNGDFVTVDGNVVEPTSSASAAPKYAIGLQNSTGVFVRNQVAGHTMDMSLKPVAKGANPLAQRVFKVEENWTFGRLGLYIAGGYSLAEPARIANNHFVMSQEYGDDADTHLVSLKGISAPGTIVEGNVFTGFRKNYSGLWVQSRPNVTIQGNTFQPLAGQSDFRAIVVGNWSLQTGVPPSPATFDVTIRGNTFLANGATSINKGKAILFVDDNDASGAATFTKAVVGGSQLADANSFDSGIGWYIALDDRTCTGRNHASTSGGCNGGAGYAIGQGINYTSGTDGSSISQKRPFKWDVQAAGNSFGGVYMPSMGLAQFNAVWAKTYDKHNAGDTTVGNVLYGYPPITSGTITFTPTAFAYDGNAHPISATLAEDPDATCIVTPATITNAGTHAVAADCVSSTYHVTGSDSVVVSKAAGSVVWGTLNFTYDGSSPTVTATLAEETGVSCAVTGAVGPNAGSYPVSASCNGSNHTASGNATATIAKATGTVAWGTLAFTYDGSSPTVTATLAEETGVTCAVTGAVGPNAGSYPVSASCNGSNHTASGNATATIAKAAGTVTWGTLAFTYDGSSPTVTATLAEETGVACAVTGTVGPNAGSYPISASCNGSNHTASGNATATIAKATGAVAWGTLNFTYDGSSPTVTATLAEETGVACTVTGTVGPNAGSYPVIASCDGSNHAASGNATATIAKATGTVSFGPTNFTFDGTAHSTTVELAQEPAVTCALTPTGDYPRLHAGSTTLAATCAGTNYEASGSTTLVVAAKGVSLALTGLGTFPYDGNPHPAGVTVTGEVTGFPAVVDITYDGGATPPVGVGSHAVAAELAASATDYSASPVSGLIVIEVAQATVTLGDLSAVYDGDPHAASVSTEPTGLTVSVTYDGVNDVPVNAGSYAVVATVTQQGYSGSASGTLVIAKAEATVAITDTTQAWDGNPKPVTVTTTPANLAVAVTYDGDGTPPSAVGSYAVVATITDANHSGSANATLTITAGAASGIAANGATTFTGVAGQPLTGALPAVKVTDAGGHPVAGVAVTFTAGANSGTLTGASQTTDSSGIATLGGWILDATPGTNTVVASAAGVTGTVAFTATGVSVLDGFNVSISDGRNATQVGRLLTYTITVGNAGSFGANGVHVTDMLPDELDVAGAQWQCSASNGASCTASGSGDLDDTIDLPAGGSVVYLLTAQVVADIDGMIDNGVTVAAGGNSIVRTDSTEIVIFRDGFELGGDGSDWDEAIEPVAAGSLSETQELTLDVAGLAPLQRVTVAQAADRTFAVEAIRIGETVLVRLVAGRQATAWSALDGERFALVLVGTRLGLVGAQADLVVELAQGGSLAVERLMHH